MQQNLEGTPKAADVDPLELVVTSKAMDLFTDEVGADQKVL